MSKALGLLEVYGFSTGLYVVDAACKAANVTVQALDKNRPFTNEPLAAPLLITIRFRGSIDDVTEAVEVGKRAANELTGWVNAKVIARPDEGLEQLLEVSCI